MNWLKNLFRRRKDGITKEPYRGHVPPRPFPAGYPKTPVPEASSRARYRAGTSPAPEAPLWPYLASDSLHAASSEPPAAPPSFSSGAGGDYGGGGASGSWDSGSSSSDSSFSSSSSD